MATTPQETLEAGVLRDQAKRRIVKFVTPHEPAATTDIVDGGTLYDADGREVLAVASDTSTASAAIVVDVTAAPYNVVADNVTDFTAEIQAALDAAIVTVPGVSAGNDYAARIVQLPPGRTVVRGHLVSSANTWFRGHGPSGSYLYRPNGTGDANPVLSVAPAGVQNAITDLGIICDDATVDCLEIAGAGSASILGDMRCVVDQVVTVGGRDGLRSDQAIGQGNELRVTRFSSYRASRNGVWVDTTDAFLSTVTAAGSGTGGLHSDAVGIRLQGANSRLTNSKVFGVLGAFSIGVYASGGGRHQLAAVEVQDCEKDAFNISGNDPSTGRALLADSCGGFGFVPGAGDDVEGVALNRVGGGLYTMKAALLGTPGANVKLRTKGVRRLANDSGANQASYDTGLLDIDNRFGIQQIAYAASITPDPWQGQDVAVGTLTGALTVANPATTTDPFGFYPSGMRLTFQLPQDSTGGRTITFGAAYKLVGGGSTISGEAASAVRTIAFRWDGTNWRETGRAVT